MSHLLPPPEGGVPIVSIVATDNGQMCGKHHLGCWQLAAIGMDHAQLRKSVASAKKYHWTNSLLFCSL